MLMRSTIPLFFSFCLAVHGASEPEKPAENPPKETPPAKVVEPVTKESSVEIAGKKVPYKVTTGKIQLKKEDGKARASIFHVSYERTDVKNTAERPVLFAFNGGPGSSAVWLHLGILGPKIIKLPGDGTTAPEPPTRLADNPMSLLDVADLVFVDPVSTGYSRAENDTKPGEFHGLNEDIESVGDFIRLWISEHDRWASPKFLLGESYGGIRVAGLSQHLQSRYGMHLNGVVLMSSLLDFSTLQPSSGNDLGYLVYLPSYAGTAHFHGKVKGDREELIQKSTEYAFGEYSAALLKGNSLATEARQAVAGRLAGFTGISEDLWLKHNLRLDPGVFRNELLRAEGKVIGRFDARVAWDSTDKTSPSAEYDPSYSLAYGAFATAMMSYLGHDLGYKEDQPYEILTGKVSPWNWNAENQVINLSGKLATALRDNPHLRVLVMGGRTDLATPPEGVAYSLRHLLDLPSKARNNIWTTHYDGGHMFYLNPPDLAKARQDLVKFLHGEKP